MMGSHDLSTNFCLCLFLQISFEWLIENQHRTRHPQLNAASFVLTMMTVFIAQTALRKLVRAFTQFLDLFIKNTVHVLCYLGISMKYLNNLSGLSPCLYS